MIIKDTISSNNNYQKNDGLFYNYLLIPLLQTLHIKLNLKLTAVSHFNTIAVS